MILPGGKGRIAGVDFNPDGPSRLRLAILVDDAAVELADALVPNYALVAACVWERADHDGLRIVIGKSATPVSLSMKSGSVSMKVPSTQILSAEMVIDDNGVASMLLDMPIESRHGRRAVELINRPLEVRIGIRDDDAPEVVDNDGSLEEAGRMTANELKSLRRSAGVSRDELAGALDISRKTVQRYESGERRVPRDLGDKIRALLDPSSQEAPGGEDP